MFKWLKKLPCFVFGHSWKVDSTARYKWFLGEKGSYEQRCIQCGRIEEKRTTEYTMSYPDFKLDDENVPTIVLTADEFGNVTGKIENPPAPNDALKKLMRDE